MVARMATSTEMRERLADKVTPYKAAVEEARQLCFMFQTPGIVWEYVPEGQNKWRQFGLDDIAKIEKWCLDKQGEPYINVRINSVDHVVDMEQMRMSKLKAGMGFQGGGKICPVALCDCLALCLTSLALCVTVWCCV